MGQPADGDSEDGSAIRRDAAETVRDDAYYARISRSIEDGDYVITGPLEYGPGHPIKLFVDDLRPAPDDTWTVARSSAEALQMLRSGVVVAEISLDHDLGGEDTTRPIVLHLCEHGGWPATVRVHTANPVGREWLTGMINRYGPRVTR